MSPLIDEANHVDFITGLDAVIADLHNPCSISQKQYRAGPLLNRSSDPRVAQPQSDTQSSPVFPAGIFPENAARTTFSWSAMPLRAAMSGSTTR